jgi:hypothetical protein
MTTPTPITEEQGTIHWGPEAVHFSWHAPVVAIGSGQPNAEFFTDYQEWYDRLIELGVPAEEIPDNGQPIPY